MQFKALSELLVKTWNTGGVSTPFIFLGPPGIGKTSLGRYVAEQMSIQVQEGSPSAPPAICRVLDLTSMLPEDLIGLPWRNQEEEVTDYAPQRWLAELCEPGAYGILILDDLPAASPAVQVAARQIVLDRGVHEHQLADGIMVIVTGNRREDKAKSSNLPSQFINSCCVMELNPDLEGWIEWYMKQPGMSSDVPSFLRYRPVHLSYLPKEADKRGAFATPRTWAKLGEMWDVAHELGFGLEVSQGLVGEGCATEFVAFVNVKSKLCDPMEVLRNPKQAIPNPESYLGSPDKVYAMVTAIAEHGYANKMALEFLVALGHCSMGNKEYVSASINHWKAIGEKDSMSMLIRAIRKAGKDPKLTKTIEPVMEWLAKVHGN